MPEEGEMSEGMADAYHELEQKIVARQTLRQLEDYIERRTCPRTSATRCGCGCGRRQRLAQRQRGLSKKAQRLSAIF